MSAPSTSTLPWLDRLNLQIPGYQGYQQPSWRRHADESFRQALLHRLQGASDCLRQSRSELEHREVRRELPALDELSKTIEKVVAQVRLVPSFDPFLEAQEFGPAQAETLHALDHALLERADRLRELTALPSAGHDWLATVRQQIDQFGRQLDARTSLLRQLI